MKIPVQQVVLAVLVLAGCASASPQSPWLRTPESPLVVEESREILKTKYQVRLWFQDAKSRAQAAGIFQKAFAELERVAAISDHSNPESELSKVNAKADKAPVAVSPELFEMFQIAATMYARSEGVFDVTFLPIQEAVQKHGDDAGLESGVHAYGAEVAAEKRRVGQANLILSPKGRTVRFGKPRMKAGLLGLAKGYAATRAAMKLGQIQGLDGFAVIAGSVIVAGGPDAFADPGLMCIESPADLGSCAYRIHPSKGVKLLALAMSASSDRPGQIYDPKSGLRKARDGGVVVAGTDGAWVQATATAASAMDNKRTAALLKKGDHPKVVGGYFEAGFTRSLTGTLEPLAKLTQVQQGEVIAR